MRRHNETVPPQVVFGPGVYHGVGKHIKTQSTLTMRIRSLQSENS